MGLGSLCFSPCLAKYSFWFGFYAVRYFKNMVFYEKRLLSFPSFLYPPDFTQAIAQQPSFRSRQLLFWLEASLPI